MGLPQSPPPGVDWGDILTGLAALITAIAGLLGALRWRCHRREKKKKKDHPKE